MGFDSSLSETAGSRLLDRLVRCSLMQSHCLPRNGNSLSKRLKESLRLLNRHHNFDVSVRLQGKAQSNTATTCSKQHYSIILCVGISKLDNSNAFHQWSETMMYVFSKR